ncbi:MAG: thioredoxin domain-containing protein [Proteobacteria bacterium]|nr:thioredoxin domain-containing protein [Pseudomonadota bacterium]
MLTLLPLGCRTAASGPHSGKAARSGDQRQARSGSGKSTASIRRKGNHLVGEPSPYLEQHAHNPVDWYPWGKEALDKAKRENKPIFLSIGYATCHWCHVMEKESFEDDTIAAYLNQHFVSIKVDREQRPDLDALYIEAVAAMGGSTGWPLTVFLTPKLEPFFGGTYFPPRSRFGRPGFIDVLRQVLERFRKEGDRVAARGRQIFQAIRAAALPKSNERKVDKQILDEAFARLHRARDPVFGGFGFRQKFPNAPLLLAELRYGKRGNHPRARAHLVLTLEQMMRGGIRDHLQGTFHRYAVDRHWHVPHFEKMLYDNAQLASLYVEAGLWLDRDDFVRVGRAVLDDLIATWQQPDGGLVVGFDADDPLGEGVYYSWTPAELHAALGKKTGHAIASVYGVSEQGDRELEGARSVLHRQPAAEVESKLGLAPQAIERAVASALPALLRVRARRPRPAMDDKELVAWNGLALIALADVGRWLEEPRYVEAGQRIARFVLESCWQPEKRRMLRGLRRGASLGEGFVDDYALAALGLLHLHAADGQAQWLQHAVELVRAIELKFYDPGLATFMHTAREDIPEGLPLRRAKLDDGVVPAGANAATLLMLQLGAIAGDRLRYEIGLATLQTAAANAAAQPFSSGFLLTAVDHRSGPVREVVIAGAKGEAQTQALLAELRPHSHARFLPVRIPAEGAGQVLVASLPALRGKKAFGGRPTAFVCELGRCELPTGDPAVLRRQLRGALAAADAGH